MRRRRRKRGGGENKWFTGPIEKDGRRDGSRNGNRMWDENGKRLGRTGLDWKATPIGALVVAGG
jgi:hypothetical protein